jgi:hypothetical protein
MIKFYEFLENQIVRMDYAYNNKFFLEIRRGKLDNSLLFLIDQSYDWVIF